MDKRPSLRDGAFSLVTRLRVYARLIRDKVHGASCRTLLREDTISATCKLN